MKQVVINGQQVDFEAAVNLMDRDIREQLHNNWDASSAGNVSPEDGPQAFVDAYVKAHKDDFSENFVVN